MLNVKQIIYASNGILLNGKEESIIKNYVIDSRIVQKEDFFIPIVGNNNNGHDYIIDCVKNGIIGFFIESSEKNKEKIISECIKINKDICIIEVIKSVDALYKIGKYNRKLHMDIPVIAITGSVGKTSTREMVASILSQKFNLLTTYKNYNGYIGLSLMLLKLEDQDIALLEHGIDSIGEMSKLSEASKPNVAVVTMIGTAHIGIFGNRDNIFREKMDVCKYMNKGNVLILNNDDEFLSRYINSNLQIEKYNFIDAKEIKENGEYIEFKTNIYGKEEKVKLNEIAEHNIYNALAGIKVAELFKIEKEKILKGIKEYKNLPGRFEKISLKGKIQIIDDTYNASIDSMKSGIKAINLIEAKRKIAVLGDMFELGEYSDSLHEEVGKLFKETNVNSLYTLGEKAKLIAKEAKKYLKEVYILDNKEELIKALCKETSNGDLIYFKASNGMKFNQIMKEVKEYLENK